MELDNLSSASANSNRAGNNIRFPPDMIVALSIFTHGEIEFLRTGLDTNTIDIFTIPEKLTSLYKFNAANPGAINYGQGEAGGQSEMDHLDSIQKTANNPKARSELFSASDAHLVNTTITQRLSLLSGRPSPRAKSILDQTVEIVGETMYGHNLDNYMGQHDTVSELEEKQRNSAFNDAATSSSDMITEGVTKVKFTDADKESLDHSRAFIQSSDRMPRDNHGGIDCLTNNPRREMVNKTYILQAGNVSSAHDWEIRCLNPGYENVELFNLVYQRNNPDGASRQGHGDRSITTQQLLNWCVERGARSIVIFDGTCSPIKVPVTLSNYTYSPGQAIYGLYRGRYEPGTIGGIYQDGTFYIIYNDDKHKHVYTVPRDNIRLRPDEYVEYNDANDPHDTRTVRREIQKYPFGGTKRRKRRANTKRKRRANTKKRRRNK